MTDAEVRLAIWCDLRWLIIIDTMDSFFWRRKNYMRIAQNTQIIHSCEYYRIKLSGNPLKAATHPFPVSQSIWRCLLKKNFLFVLSRNSKLVNLSSIFICYFLLSSLLIELIADGTFWFFFFGRCNTKE